MNSDKLNVCVIDDEPMIRESLVETLNESTCMRVVGEADSVRSGIELILDKNPDAVFLDIKLREGDAFQLLNALLGKNIKLPPIILNTGYSDFEFAQRALNEYGDVVVNILQKPFWEHWNAKEDQILHAIQRYREKDVASTSFSASKIKIKSDYKTYLIHYDEIKFIEVPEELKGRGKLEIVTEQDSYVITHSLKEIVSSLPRDFVQISRFCIVNGDRISHFDHSDHVIFLKGMKRNFSVGRTYIDRLNEWMEL